MGKEIIIKPKSKWLLIDFKELWEYRELFYVFVWRDIKVRYKQTVIGGSWAVLQPLLTMIIFSFFFGKIAKIPSEGVPYPIFSYSGLLLWTYFSNAVNLSSNSMLGNASLISKIFFPRIILPMASTFVGIVDYLISALILILLMFYYGITPGINLVFLPLILIGTCILSMSIGFWLSALNVKYRDIRLILPFFIQLLVFVTPVIYPTSVAGNYKWLVMLNPMTGLIETHRDIILNQPVNFELLGISLIITLIIFISGLIYFRSVERYFADII